MKFAKMLQKGQIEIWHYLEKFFLKEKAFQEH